MIRRIFLSAAFTLIALPAFAADQVSCEKTEYPPATMQPELFGQQPVAQQKTTLEGVLANYKRYEDDLKGYRSCITAALKVTTLARNKALRDNKNSEADKQKDAAANLNKQWNTSVDEETRVVNEMTALAKIYCAHTTDPGICHKFKL